jgi:hypothetical protein
MLQGPSEAIHAYPVIGAVLGDNPEHCKWARSREIHYHRPNVNPPQHVCFRCRTSSLHLDMPVTNDSIITEEEREVIRNRNVPAELKEHCILDHVQSGLVGLKYADPGQICVVDYDHMMLEGLGKDLWDWTKQKIKAEFSTQRASKIFKTIDERFAILGKHMRTGKFLNGVVKLTINASKDIYTLLKYLPFVVLDLLPNIWISCLLVFHILAAWFHSPDKKDWSAEVINKMLDLAICLQDHFRALFTVFSKSHLLFKKMHLLLEVFVIDIILHSALANCRCAMLEGLHPEERKMNQNSNQQDSLKTFSTKRSAQIWRDARASLAGPLNLLKQPPPPKEIAGHFLGEGGKYMKIADLPKEYNGFAACIKVYFGLDMSVHDVKQFRIKIFKTTKSR